MANPSSSNVSGRLRTALEILSSVALVVLAALVAYQFMVDRPGAAERRPAVVPIPEAPISLKGASLLGSTAAPVVLLEFSDFECPFCGKFATAVLPSLRTEFIDTGQLQFAFRHFPLERHSNALAAAKAAVCADEQNRFGQFHEMLFANPKGLDAESLNRYMGDAGLDMTVASACLRTTGTSRVEADTKLAQALGITATPAFLVGHRISPSEIKVRKTLLGAKPLNEFVAAIKDVLDR